MPPPSPPDWSTFTIGEKQDRTVFIEVGMVTIMSTSEPSKGITLTTSGWHILSPYYKQIDIEAKELNCKMQLMAFHVHVGDGFYISMKDGSSCVDLRCYFSYFSCNICFSGLIIVNRM